VVDREVKIRPYNAFERNHSEWFRLRTVILNEDIREDLKAWYYVMIIAIGLLIVVSVKKLQKYSPSKKKKND